MPLRMLPVLAGLLPIVAINLSLLLAMTSETVPSCIPYFDGCTSISATGRHEPASFVFKPAMLSESVLMIAYWLLNMAWLRALSSAAGNSKKGGTWMGIFGCAGALALILYVTFLGTHAPFYEFMRRFGVYLYFLFTIIAQLLLSRDTIRLSIVLDNLALRRIGQIQFTFALIPLGFGILNMTLKATLDNSGPAENIIEWHSAFLMHCFIILSYYSWQKSNFAANWSVQT